MVPVVDIVEIGAGGGSIAWIDDGGALRVGPKSAGAEPGPACYGRAAARADGHRCNCSPACSTPSTSWAAGSASTRTRARGDEADQRPAWARPKAEFANGVIRLVNANMINALKLVSVRRGTTRATSGDLRLNKLIDQSPGKTVIRSNPL